MNTHKNMLTFFGVVVLMIGLISAVAWKMFGPSSQTDQASSAPTTSAAPQLTQTVIVTDAGFNPATVTIKAGGTVQWMNNSSHKVSINSNNHPTHLLYPPLNLGIVEVGKSVSLQFNTPGKYGYHNHLDPSQTGTVLVE